MSTATKVFPEQRPSASAVAQLVTGGTRRLLFDPTLRKGVWSVVDQGIVSGTSFLTTVIVGRLCGPAELGIYFLALSFVTIARAVQSDLIGAPFVVYCQRRRGADLASYAGSTLLHQTILSATSVVALAILIGIVAFSGGFVGMTGTLMVMLGAVPILLLREIIRDFAFGCLQVTRAVAFDAIVAVLQLGTLMLLAGTGMLTVERVYLVMGGACAVACGCWFWAKSQQLVLNRDSVLQDWWENWSFAKWAIASQLVGRATSYLMPWIVAAAHGEAATGLLAACITLVNMMGTFITGVSRFLTPKAAQAFAEGGPDSLRRLLLRVSLLFLSTMCVFCAVMYLAGGFVVGVVYGPLYSGAGSVLSILALAMLADSLGIIVGNGLWAINQPKANFVADAATLIVTIAVIVCLVHPLGVTGAAWSILAGAVAGAAVRSMTFCIKLPTGGGLLAAAATPGSGQGTN